jgi:hypothetical protein
MAAKIKSNGESDNLKLLRDEGTNARMRHQNGLIEWPSAYSNIYHSYPPARAAVSTKIKPHNCKSNDAKNPATFRDFVYQTRDCSAIPLYGKIAFNINREATVA